MKTGDQYPKTSELVLLLVGESGSGKTSMCMQFPDPYFIDTGDSNLINGIRAHPGKKFTYDTVTTDTETSAAIAPQDCWPRVLKLIKENGSKPEVGSVIVDTITTLSKHLCRWLTMQPNGMEKTVLIAGEAQMNRSLWTPYESQLRSLIMMLTALKKPVVVTSHLRMDKDEVLGTWKGLPTIQGALVHNLASIFTDYWMCETKQVPIDATYPRGVKYTVRTAPNNRLELKTSIKGLPPEMTFTWAEFEKYFNK
jgi:AAA domain